MQIEINGHSCFYQENVGPDPMPVIFIHGFPLTHEMWAPQVKVVGERYRAIAYDLRGFGKSGCGDGQYTMDLYVDDLCALLDHLKIASAVLCGLSMGGYIALRFKERELKRVKALILADTKSEADNDEAKIKRAQALKRLKSEGVGPFAESFLSSVYAPTTFSDQPRLIEKTRKIICGNTPIGIGGALLALASRTDTTAALTQSPVPTLVLVGREDKIIPPEVAQAMHEKSKLSTLSILSHAAHMSNLENSTDFNAALSSFLQSLK